MTIKEELHTPRLLLQRGYMCLMKVILIDDMYGLNIFKFMINIHERKSQAEINLRQVDNKKSLSQNVKIYVLISSAMPYIPLLCVDLFKNQ